MDRMEELMRKLNKMRLEEGLQHRSTTQVSTTTEIPTSAHTLLSCVHGRDRRLQRHIGKRDLQAAIKYGDKEPGDVIDKLTGELRWKYTYKDIVYITDSTSRVEVTSWVKPILLPEAYVTSEDVRTHDRLTLKLRQSTNLLTSHTIFIVDQSGSMKTHDVDNFKTRSDAVFGTLALDYIGKQIDQSSINHTDCASLIFMKDDAEVIFEREAIDNVLYNKILSQINKKPGSHGNYLPALKKGIELLQKDIDNPNCALLILFLSDGRPSDCSTNSYFGLTEFKGQLEYHLGGVARKFGDRLTFGAIGFNRKSDQFSILQAMTEICKTNGANSTFQHAKGDSETLSVAISTLTSSIVESKTILTALAGQSRQTVRSVKQEKITLPTGLYPDPNEWHIYYAGNRNVLEHAEWNQPYKRWDQKAVEYGVRGIAIRKSYFGDGAERIVFLLRKLGVDRNSRPYFLPGNFVAKECKHVEAERLKYDFHTTFYTTQMKAQDIADAFNKKISETKRLHPYISVAKITFLQCWVYTFYPAMAGYNHKGVLCEKYIDGKYTKWNSNNGHVEGAGKHAMNNKLGNVENAPMSLGAILEDSSEEESEDEFESEINPIVSSKKYHVSIDDYPQCFSHFSYRHTGRKMLVCDLQGGIDSLKQPPVYELTDPVIHKSPNNQSGKQRQAEKRKFGRTDLGDKGINKFFETHRCNNLCILLGLPANK